MAPVTYAIAASALLLAAGVAAAARSRRARATPLLVSVASVALAGAALAIVNVASATHWSSIDVWGDEGSGKDRENQNPTCADVASRQGLPSGHYNELKVDHNPPTEEIKEGQTYKDEPPYHEGTTGPLEFKVDNLEPNDNPNTTTLESTTLDWSSNIGVDVVIMKGGNTGANAYHYNSEAKADTGLKPPLNQDKTTQPAISHFSACYDVGATVSGIKFEDKNGNGTKDSGDPVLSGWRLYVDLNGDGNYDDGTVQGEPAEPTAVTDANGKYLITDIPTTTGSSTRNVREEVKSGWKCTKPSGCAYAETFPDATTKRENKDFGNFKLATVEGTKFDDKNGDGTRQSSTEPGLQNWRIYVDLNGDNDYDDGTQQGQPAEPTALTDANGNYKIEGVGPGTFDVQEVTQSGWSCTGPSGCAHSHTFQSGDALTGKNFANFDLITVSGTKFEDKNGDGTRQSSTEPVLSGWTIFIDKDKDGTLDSTESSTTTGSDGSYQFTDVGPNDLSDDGKLRLREETQTGWDCTAPSNCVHLETITSGQNLTGKDFANFDLITVSGTKFEDTDGDGTKDTGEPVKSGWTVFIDKDKDGNLDSTERSTTTGSDGTYQFTDVGPDDLSDDGKLRVSEETQAGWDCTAPSACTHLETITSGQDLTGKDFANFDLITVSGTKFEDTDGDGQKDTGELGKSGWTIFIDKDKDGTLDSTERSTTTGSDGSYQFTDVGPDDLSDDGKLRLREETQTGWDCTAPANCVHLETITSGQNLTGKNFANFDLITVSGTKFEDTDGDGAKDSGEPGKSGWTIFIDRNNNGTKDSGEPEATTSGVSGSEGNYEFTGVGPDDLASDGKLHLREQTQSGWDCTGPSGCHHAETISSGQDLTGKHFANFELATVEGTKFEDKDRNGTKDSGDPGLSGWTIFLDKNDNNQPDTNERSATTGQDGSYKIDGIGPGAGVVKEVQQSGWSCTAPDPCTYSHTFQSGDALTGRNFGNFTPATVAGTKFQDTNGNGSRDSGESGLKDWRIFVDYDGDSTYDDGSGQDPAEPTALTDADGKYEITGVTAGSFHVREVQQSGWNCTAPSPCSHAQAFQSSDKLTGRDFGNVQPSTAQQQPGGGQQQGGTEGQAPAGGGEREAGGQLGAQEEEAAETERELGSTEEGAGGLRGEDEDTRRELPFTGAPVLLFLLMGVGLLLAGVAGRPMAGPR